MSVSRVFRDSMLLCRAKFLGALSLAALIAADAYAQIPCAYEIAAIIESPDCGILGQAAAVGTGISPNGQYVCGYFTCPGGNDVAFLYAVKTGEVTTIPFSQGFYSMIANDVNDSAIVVGTGQKTTAGLRGFVHDSSSGITTELLPQNLPDGWSEANAINNAGTVCGWRTLDDGGSPVTPFNAFIWSTSIGFTDLGVMNGPNSAATGIAANGVVVGWTGSSASSSNALGFILEQGKTFILPTISGGSSSALRATSDQGKACGRGLVPPPPGFSNTLHALLYHKGESQDLGTIEGYVHSFALDLNDSTVVGYCRTLLNGSDSLRSFVWQSEVMYDLSVLIAPSSSVPDISIAWAISDVGSIACEANYKGEIVAVVLFPRSRPPGDTNCDELVNVDDLLNVIDEWGACTACAADLTIDGIVDNSDLMIVIDNWTHL